ncbi:nuclear export factor GLE1 [Micromonospora sp. ATCC 39149]|nr:nuclear export factor GLE1 [Micromonospora sp. ATCC 39149]
MIGRDNRRLRISAAAVLAVVAAALGWPGTALAADVTSTPSQARQGDPVRLEIVVPEERPGARTERIELRLPAAAPVGEAYPMSVTGWAPRITTRKLTEPISGIHGTTMDTVTASVIWARAKGAPAGPARLAVSMGPLPQADRMVFEVVQTYSDGTVVRWADPAGRPRPAPVLTLLPRRADMVGSRARAHAGGPSDRAAAAISRRRRGGRPRENGRPTGGGVGRGARRRRRARLAGDPVAATDRPGRGGRARARRAAPDPRRRPSPAGRGRDGRRGAGAAAGGAVGQAGP